MNSIHNLLEDTLLGMNVALIQFSNTTKNLDVAPSVSIPLPSIIFGILFHNYKPFTHITPT